jgi:hypothetical protein
MGEDYIRMEMELSTPMNFNGGDGVGLEGTGEPSEQRVELYFTYRGLLRCLFASRKPVACFT